MLDIWHLRQVQGLTSVEARSFQAAARRWTVAAQSLDEMANGYRFRAQVKTDPQDFVFTIEILSL